MRPDCEDLKLKIVWSTRRQTIIRFFAMGCRTVVLVALVPPCRVVFRGCDAVPVSTVSVLHFLLFLVQL